MRKKDRIRTAPLLGLLAAMALAPSANAANATFADISPDGTRIYFETTERMVPADTDTVRDVYERSSDTNATRLISTGGNSTDAATFEGASDDGAFVFFSTAEPVTPGTDSDGSIDVYMRSSGGLTHISRGAINGNGAFNAAFQGASDDGTRIIFRTAEPLVSSDDDDSNFDIYRRSTAGPVTELMSVPATGHTPTDENVDISFEGVSADGSRVFTRTAQRLTSTDTDSSQDIFRHDLGSAAVTIRISFGPDGGNGANNVTWCDSDDAGTRVFFRTSEVLVAPGSGAILSFDYDSSFDIYVREIGDETGLLSGDDHIAPAEYDASCAQDRSANSTATRGLYTTEEELSATTAAGTPPAGEANGNDVDVFRVAWDYETNGIAAFNAYMSVGGDGRDASIDRMTPSGFTLYSTGGADLGSDTDDCGSGVGCDDVYSHPGTDGGDRRRWSTGPQNDNSAHHADYADDDNGADVMFSTAAALVSTDTDGATDVYVRDFGDSTTVHASRGVINGNGPIDATPEATASDHHVFTTAEALRTNDVDSEIDVYEWVSGSPRLVSVDTVPPVVTITGGPVGSTTNDTTPTFTFMANEPSVTFNCRFDLGPLGGCTSGSFTAPSPLSTGPHTFEARGSDVMGNDAAPATANFTVDPNFGVVPPTTAAAENPLCATLRAKLKRLNRKIKRTDDPDQKKKLKAKRRKVRKQLAALGC